MSCVMYSAGVIATLVVYGLMQERIMQVPYDGQIFTYSLFLVCCNRMAGMIWGISAARACKESIRPQAPIWMYVSISVANTAASTCQCEALKYVSFAVQLVGKSFKMMPVMIWGVLISGKKYTWQDWAVAMAVTGGVAQFLMTGPVSPTKSAPAGSSAIGFAILLAFLAFDGMTSTMQEKVFQDHDTSKNNQMIYINGCSFVLALMTLSAQGGLGASITFFLGHSTFAFNCVMLSMTAVGGQIFIYSLIQDFGALALAATMNVRQMISIIISYVVYHHPITLQQVIGLSTVFSALFYKAVIGVKKSQERHRERLVSARGKDGYSSTAGGGLPDALRAAPV